MTSEIAGNRNRIPTWVLGGSMALALALAAAAAILWSWPLKVVAGVLQLLGIALTVLGVAVVRSWLEKATEKAVESKEGLERWLALRQERFRHWWARRRRRPIVVEASGTAIAHGRISGRATIAHPRVDRETISDRDWLAFLDDRLGVVFQRLDQADKARDAIHSDLVQRLRAQRDALRDEVLLATRQGWELIIAGLACSAVGTALGMAA